MNNNTNKFYLDEKKIKGNGESDKQSLFTVTLMSQARGVDHQIDLPVRRWLLPAGTSRENAIAMANDIAIAIAKRVRAKMAKTLIATITSGDTADQGLISRGQVPGPDVLPLVGLSIELEELTTPPNIESLLLGIHESNFDSLFEKFS